VSALIEEVGYFGKLEDFTAYQKRQMANWLASYSSRGMLGIGLIRSCEAVVKRAAQGSSYYATEKIIKSMLDERTGLDGRKGLEDQLAIAILDGGAKPCNLLDSHFFNYGDGSITVGYDHTGFMIAHDDNSVVAHPETRFTIHLPEPEFDLSYSQQAALVVTGRTLFFYRLVQACQGILDAERGVIGATPPESKP